MCQPTRLMAVCSTHPSNFILGSPTLDFDRVEKIPYDKIKGGTIRVIYIVIALIVILAAGGSYYYYYMKSLESLKTSPFTNPSTIQASPTPTPQEGAEESCSQFNARFGSSASELVHFINNEPDSAKVMQGYRYVSGTVISLTPVNNLPLFITFDGNGKIIAFSCSESKISKDYTKDFDFTIPENDFAQIVRYRESLEASGAPTYLQNVTTKPAIVKQTILERIQMLGQ